MAELKILLSAIGGDAVAGAFNDAARRVELLDEAIKGSTSVVDKFTLSARSLQAQWAPEMLPTAAFDSIGKSLFDALTPAKAFEAAMSAAAAAVSMVGEGVSAMAGAVYDVGTKFDRLQVQMDAVFGQGNAADRALQWAQDFESGVPQDIEEITQRMIALKRQGFDPLADGGKLMTALGDAAQATGLSFERILDPLAKMNVTGLADFKSLTAIAKEGIPVFEILEEKTGMTADQIKEMGADALDGRAAMELLAEALGDRYAGAMEKATRTAEVGLSKIGDLGEDAAKRIADAGAWESFTDAVMTAKDAISDVLDTVEFDRFAKAVSDVFTGASEQVQLFAKTAATALPKVLDLAATTMEGLGALLSTRKDSFWDFLSGEDIVKRSEQQVANFEKRYLEFMQKAREAKDMAAIGEVITEEDVEATERNIVKEDKLQESRIKKIDDYFKEKIKGEEKAAKESERLQQQLSDKQEALNKRLSDRAMEAQKDILREELKAEEERMDNVRDAMENRNKMEKLVWDYRQSLADAQFDRENEQEEKLMKRRHEDQAIAFSRENEDVLQRAKDYLSGKAIRSYDPEVTNLLRDALKGKGGYGFGADRDGTLSKALDRYIQDQERMLRRTQEDEMDALENLNEDEKRDREFLQKTDAEQRAQSFKAMVDLATSLKDFKGNIEHKIKIIEQTKFVNEFMKEVFKTAGIKAKLEAIQVAGV